jgi:hypothetical protein
VEQAAGLFKKVVLQRRKERKPADEGEFKQSTISLLFYYMGVALRTESRKFRRCTLFNSKISCNSLGEALFVYTYWKQQQHK